MTPHISADVWATGAAYDPYVGRWSRVVAREFLAWLDLPPQWDAALALDPAAAAHDEGQRFPLCQPDALAALWRGAELARVKSCALEVPTRFQSFDDFWTPFLGGQGPAPSYVMSLASRARDTLREHLRSALPIAPDGSIALTARAWAVRGIRG